MKKLVVFLLAFTLSSNAVFANNEKPTEKEKKQLRTEIVKLLGNNEFPLEGELAKAELLILLNNKNELVIVSVKSENNLLASYVKRKLNYKKIRTGTLKKMKIYKMPIKIIKA